MGDTLALASQGMNLYTDLMTTTRTINLLPRHINGYVQGNRLPIVATFANDYTARAAMRSVRSEYRTARRHFTGPITRTDARQYAIGYIPLWGSASR